MQDAVEELCEIVARRAPDRDGSALVGVSFCSDGDATNPPAIMGEPLLLFVLRGSVTIIRDDEPVIFDAPSVVPVALDRPEIGSMAPARNGSPPIILSIALCRDALRDLFDEQMEQPAIRQIACESRGIDAATIDALLRLARVADTPADAPMLVPLVIREILYRTVRGGLSEALRRYILGDVRAERVRRVLDWIESNLERHIDVAQLADIAGMSATSFHRHFRATTAASPLQFVKEARLRRARQLLLCARDSVSQIAFSVGYCSASHFSRDYARRFGHAPTDDLGKTLGLEVHGGRS